MIEPFDISGKVIAITGASSGLGHHFAGTLSTKGATTILGARRKDKLESRVEEITDLGGKAEALPLDVNDSKSINEFLDQAFKHYGRVDVLINNAGVEAGAKTYQTTEEEDWDYVINTNLKSAWMISNCLLYTSQSPRDRTRYRMPSSA